MVDAKKKEKELIAALKEGSEKAFSTLVSMYQERLYWHIRNMVKNHEDADDVLQSVFIKVFRSIHTFKEDSLLYTWLYRIATNEAITHINKKAKKMHLTAEAYQEQAVASLAADVYFEGDEIQLKLQKALATLPLKQQQVFQMKYFEEITYDAMSTITQTSVGALKSSYHIAVKKITAYLKLH